MRFTLLGLLTLAAVGACKSADRAAPPATGGGTIETISFAPSLAVDLKAMTKTPSGLYYRDLAVGSGPTAEAGKRCSVKYRGQLPNGSQFDATGSGDPPLTFTPGRHEVIAGWDEGVTGMKVGGRRQLVIPPALGYGEAGNGPIPPNGIMVFMIELVGVE